MKLTDFRKTCQDLDGSIGNLEIDIHSPCGGGWYRESDVLVAIKELKKDIQHLRKVVGKKQLEFWRG